MKRYDSNRLEYDSAKRACETKKSPETEDKLNRAKERYEEAKNAYWQRLQHTQDREQDQVRGNCTFLHFSFSFFPYFFSFVHSFTPFATIACPAASLCSCTGSLQSQVCRGVGCNSKPTHWPRQVTFLSTCCAGAYNLRTVQHTHPHSPNHGTYALLRTPTRTTPSSRPTVSYPTRRRERRWCWCTLANEGRRRRWR